LTGGSNRFLTFAGQAGDMEKKISRRERFMLRLFLAHLALLILFLTVGHLAVATG
jgi:hypothetical protein